MSGRLGAKEERPRRILVVEDNEITGKLVRVTLEVEGFEVAVAGDAAAALASLRQRPADLILQDLVLPDRSGFELLAEIRALPGCADVPIVAFTGYLSDAEHRQLWALSFDDLLIKPVDPDLLARTVRAHLGKGGPATDVGAGRHVLVVDDDPVQRKLRRVTLTKAGFRVTTAADGVEGLAKALAERPDAIASDVLMPRGDGFQLCLHVRNAPSLAHVPVVLESANYVEEADRRHAQASGASELLTRTPDGAALVDALLVALAQGPRPQLQLEGGLHESYLRRVAQQLERQATLNASLMQRCSLQGAILRITAAVADALARRTDVGGALSEALSSLLDIGGISRGAVFTTGLDGDDRLSASAGLDPEASEGLGRYCREAKVFKALVEQGELALLEVGRTAGLDELLRLTSVKRALLVPLRAGEERLGVLLFGSNDRELQLEEWVAFARTVGAQLSQALGLSRAFARLASSELRYRTLMEGANDGIFIFSSAGVLREVNDSGALLLGRARPQLIGEHFTQIVAPESLARSHADFDALLRSGSVLGRETIFLRPDGTKAVADLSARFIQLGEERVVFAIAHDVTEQLRAAREVALLHRITLAASAADSLEGALRAVLLRVCEATGFAAGLAFLVRADGRALQWAASAGGTEEGQGRAALLAQSPVFTPGEGPTGQAWLGKEPVWVRDLAADRTYPSHALAAAAGVHACLAMPVFFKDEVVAVIDLFGDAPREPDERVAKLVAAVAAQLGSIVQEKRAEEALRKSELQLQQAQKIEALGQLTAGVAHDFNNMLSVILSRSAFLLEELPAGDARREDADEIRVAAERASALTRQLLAFSRTQVLDPHVLDLNVVVAGMEQMLRRLIGEQIELSIELPTAVGAVRADAGQLEQVLMNLVVNARDAISGAGRIVVETADADLEAGYLSDHGLVAPGRYVMMAVTDTGSGMTEAVRGSIFQPFFTTKQPGVGTGLGLSTCYGIVKQSGGHIWVHSELGRGTTFKIYLPRIDEAPQGARPAEASTVAVGSERILLVEDDLNVRAAALRILVASGYGVEVATDAGQALSRAAAIEGGLDLLVTDVVMPGTSGLDLALAIRRRQPSLRVLLMSGYTTLTAVLDGELGPGMAYLQKPFTRASLARKVRDVLDG